MMQFDAFRAITRRELRINYRSPLICQLGPEESGSASGGGDISGFIPVVAPAGPTNVQATVSDCPRVATLVWDAVTGALGYNVLRSDNPEGPFLYRGSVDANAFAEDMDEGTFYYRVEAFGDFGMSNPSETLSVVVPPCL